MTSKAMKAYKGLLPSMSIQALRKHAKWLYKEGWTEEAQAVARLADKFKKEQRKCQR